MLEKNLTLAKHHLILTMRPRYTPGPWQQAQLWWQCPLGAAELRATSVPHISGRNRLGATWGGRWTDRTAMVGWPAPMARRRQSRATAREDQRTFEALGDISNDEIADQWEGQLARKRWSSACITNTLILDAVVTVFFIYVDSCCGHRAQQLS